MNLISRGIQLNSKQIRVSKIQIFCISILLLYCGLVDIPNMLRFKVISLQGLSTILFTIMIWLFIIFSPTVMKNIKILIPMFIFMYWGFFSFIWFPPSIPGLQNMLVYALFIGIIVTVSKTVYFHDEHLIIKIINRLLFSCTIATIIYSSTMVIYGIGTKEFMFPRAYALFALVGLSTALSEYRYGNKKIGLWLSFLFTIIICLSLSRTATVIALGLIVLSRFKPTFFGFLKLIFISIVSISTLFILINKFEPLKQRFFTGDISMSVFGIGINAMGRTNIWDVVKSSIAESWFIGNGAGSSEEVVGNVFIVITQPHNDYLRMVHDFGIIGSAFWFIGLLSIITYIFLLWKKTTKNYKDHAKIHMASLLSFIAILLSSITDNTIVYSFVMIPTAILIGCSLGLESKIKYLGKQRV